MPMLLRIKSVLIFFYVTIAVVVLYWYNFSEFRFDLNPKDNGFFFKPCQCLKHRDRTESMFVPSSCSQESAWYGPHQKVISYSLYLPQSFQRFNISMPKPFTDFVYGIRHNLRQIRKYYPDWVVRIYTNITLSPTDEFCEVACLDIVFWCDVRESIVPNLNKLYGRIWRFIPLGDESVDIFISRDIDSYIFLREKEVVSEWEFVSDKPFHLTRDQSYLRPVMAGAWGAKNYRLGWDRGKKIRESILQARKIREVQGKDEYLLKKFVYDPYWQEFLQHDSYGCEDWNGTTPFPRRRPNQMTVVAIAIKLFGNYLAKPCPVACRPAHGANWTFC